MQEFKLIVAGGRDFIDYDRVSKTLFDLAESETFQNKGIALVSGMARGADILAVRFARQHNVKLYEFPANWEVFGKSAGFTRNIQMADFADGLLAFWDGESRGTAHMIQAMQDRNKYLKIERY